MKQSHISSVNVASWLRKSIKDVTTALGNAYIGKFCKKYRSGSKAQWYEHSPKGIVECIERIGLEHEGDHVA